MPISVTLKQCERLEEKRQLDKKILKNCFRLLEIQEKELGAQGRLTDGECHDGGPEQPLRATSWQEPSLRRVTQLCGGRFRVDGRQHGLFDHVSRTLLQKSWGWLSTSLAVKKALCRTCSHQPHQHVSAEGSRTAKSAVYPEQLCERFAKAILYDPTHFDQIKQSVSGFGLAGIFAERLVKEPEGSENGQGNSHEGESGNPGQNMDEIERDVFEKLGGPEEVNQAEIFPKVRILHSNLGHPSKEAKDGTSTFMLIGPEAPGPCLSCEAL